MSAPADGPAPPLRGGRVVTVTLNPAVDVTYAVEALVVGATVRVGGVRSRSGGKGVNVASVVTALGGDALVLALTTTGGPDGFEAGLDDLGLAHRLVPGLEAVRRTVAVVGADGRTTSLQEPGSPIVPGAEDAALAALEEELAAGAAVVVISGSLPPGAPADLPARMVRRCRAHGVPVVADLSGDALRAVAATGAVLVPNGEELADLTGSPAGDVLTVVAAGRELLAGGAAAVVVTVGEDGVVAVTRDGAWRARPVEVVVGNPTGAGDAAAAALALHLARAGDGSPVPWPEVLADVVATSAACVLRPVAGEVDAAARERWLPEVRVHPVELGAAPPEGGTPRGGADGTQDRAPGRYRHVVDDDAPTRPSGPPVLHPHDPRWAAEAEDRLRALRDALAPLVPDLGACSFDHIGSTSVPGLAAKRTVDLQVRLPALPEATALEDALAPLGWEAARGSRPDSPGVTSDLPLADDRDPEHVWVKRLFTSTDPARPGILHVRLTASPFGRRTVAFRDRLRAEPELRAAYERLKTSLAGRHAADPDYDDYTRGKTTFVQEASGR